MNIGAKIKAWSHGGFDIRSQYGTVVAGGSCIRVEKTEVF